MQPGLTTYMRIAESLRQRIHGGDWKPGQQLPTEGELCRIFNASRITIRRALQILAEERLVQRRQGSGTFISPSPVRKIPIIHTDFFESITRHAPDMTRQLQSMTLRGAETSDPEPLNLLTGDRVMHAVRVDVLRGDSVAMDEVWIPEVFADRLTEDDLIVMDFLDHWSQKQGIRLDYGTQLIEAVAADESRAVLLEIDKGAALLKETNVLFTVRGEPAAVFTSHYRSDIFRFDATIPITSRSRNRIQIEVAVD